MTIEKKLLSTNPVSGEVLPEAVSFDGATDYLARTSDLTGNADSKTFTFSAWVYWPDISNYDYIISLKPAGNVSFYVYITPQGRIDLSGRNASGTEILNLTQSTPKFAINTFVHILISVDLANTSNRYLYVNDVLSGDSLWNTYTNGSIDFTVPEHRIFRNNSSRYSQGRAAHVFLDYTYRDLSTTSNRRLFITADGKPSSTIPSNPILYLPMTDAATAGSNSGTGGDFTVNGVLATAERGPNQDNCSASVFDGSADYLSRSSVSASSGNVFTISGVASSNTNSTGHIFNNSGGSHYFYVDFNASRLLISIAAGGVKLQWQYNLPNDGRMFKRNYSFQISCDLSNTSKRHFYINGVANPTSPTTYTNSTVNWNNGTWTTGADCYGGSCSAGGSTIDVGELYFNTTYTDLATDNPFWDSDANRPNSVRKVIADTSVTPLIALPIVGNDAGNNLGSGGDFTVNSGPYTGARGGSEFWARSVKFSNAETQYLNMTSPSATSGKTFTLVMLINHSTGDNGEATIAFSNSSNIVYFTVESNTSNIKIYGKNSSGSTILSGQIDGISRRQNQWDIYLISGDMTDASKFKIYFNGVNKSIASGDWSTFTNDTLGLASSTHVNIGRSNATSGQFLTGEIANVYFSNEYTDFSQEVNRNKFIDQLGYPADLGEDGSNPTGNQPYIYATMPSSNLGKNAGSGPDFTPVASPKAGEDFIPS